MKSLVGREIECGSMSRLDAISYVEHFLGLREGLA
jgi:hypothetical protein